MDDSSAAFPAGTARLLKARCVPASGAACSQRCLGSNGLEVGTK